MSNEAPKLNNKTTQDFLNELKSRIPLYTPEWQPKEKDAGEALLKITAGMLNHVNEQLNKTPYNNFVAFLETMGMQLLPTQPALTPVKFNLTEGTKNHVFVPSNTKLSAGDTIFLTKNGFYASPSVIMKAYSVNGEKDEIFESPVNVLSGQELELFSKHLLEDSIQGSTEIFISENKEIVKGDYLFLKESNPEKPENKKTKEYVQVKEIKKDKVILTKKLSNVFVKGSIVEKVVDLSLFEGQNLQKHILYLAHKDLFKVNGKASFQLSDDLSKLPCLKWQFWGVKEDSDGQKKEDWYDFNKEQDRITNQNENIEFKETEINGIENLWVRCIISEKSRFEDLYIINDISIKPIVDESGKTPEMLFNNDIPLDVTKLNNDNESYVYPFGKPANEMNTFYIGSNEVFSKKGAKINISFDQKKYIYDSKAQIYYNIEFPEISWEYWNGKGWNLIPGLNYEFLKSSTSKMQLNVNNVKAFKYKLDDGNWSDEISACPIELNILNEGRHTLSIIEKKNNDEWQNEDKPSIYTWTNNLEKPIAYFTGILPSYNGVNLYVSSDNGIEKYKFRTHSNSDWSEERSVDIPINIQLEANLSWHNLQIIGKNESGWQNDENATIYSWYNDSVAEIEIQHSDGKKNVDFDCPNALQKSKVNGFENYWIRVRINYGAYSDNPEYTYKNWIEEDKDNEGNIIDYIYHEDKDSLLKLGAPRLSNIQLSYNQDFSNLESCLTYQNLEYQDITESHLYNKELNLLEKVPVDTTIVDSETNEQYKNNTLFLGFNQTLKEGPISIFFDIEGKKDVYPEIKWYYFSIINGWTSLKIEDNTNGFSRSETIQFMIPEDFSSTNLFGKDLFWIKIVDVKNELDIGKKIIGIHLNCVYAISAEEVKNEVLGSSDGNINQTFSFLKTPVINNEIWVNETDSITDEEKEQILKDKGSSFIKELKDEEGKIEELWIKWEELEGLYLSQENGRHYAIDYTNNQVVFGDGIEGMIPPAGIDNIIANYEFGGGNVGNVQKKQINELKSSIPYIDSVINPLAASGGANLESVNSVLSRGSKYLKHRNRAVTIEDFETLVLQASSNVARAKAYIDGIKLKIIIIPNEIVKEPIPSVMLLKLVEEYINKYRLNLVLSRNIEVIEPVYKAISIEANIVPIDFEQAVPLTKSIKTILDEHFHPLTGGADEIGWDFGRNVYLSDIYVLLEGIEGVDYVESLKLKAKKIDENGVMIDEIAEDDTISFIEVPEYSVVSSGEHDITMMMGGN